MMIPDGVRTFNDLRSPKVLKAPCILTLPLKCGCLRTLFDLGVDNRWTLTVSGPPRTPLRSPKVPRVLNLFKFKPLQYGCLWTPFDLRVDTRWMLTVSEPPKTPLRSLKVPRALLSLFYFKSLQYRCQSMDFF